MCAATVTAGIACGYMPTQTVRPVHDEQPELTSNRNDKPPTIDREQAPKSAAHPEIAVNYHTIRHMLTQLLRDKMLGHSLKVFPPNVNRFVTPEVLNTDCHKLSILELVDRFSTDILLGLPPAAKNGQGSSMNVLTPAKQASYVWLFIKQMIFGFNGALCLAAILGFISWEPIGSLGGSKPTTSSLAVAVLLVAVIMLTSIFNFYQELAANRVVQSLSMLIAPQATLLVCGSWTECSATTIRLGDIVMLAMGSKVPADLRLYEINDLKIDRSMLTGESEPVRCTINSTSDNFMESRNVVFSGTNVVEGNGKGIVVAIGDDTVLGKIGALTNRSKKRGTTLGVEINHFVVVVLTVGASCAVASAIAWSLWLDKTLTGYLTVSGFLQILLSFIVAFVPMGLPIAVTVTLGITASRMYKHHVLVKDLTTVETFNTISLIASDKTGTLTQNRMAVTLVVPFFSRPTRVQSGTSNPVWNTSPTIIQFQLFQLCITLCNNATVADGASSRKDSACIQMGQPTINGDASDVAFYNYASLHVDVSAERVNHRRLYVLPFNSSNKYMISVNRVRVRTTDGDSQVTVFMKGAPEIVMDRCNQLMDQETGRLRAVHQADRDAWSLQVRQSGERGQRVIGFGCLRLDSDIFSEAYHFGVNDNNTTNFPSTGLIFLGLVSLMDPPRPEVSDALKKCRTACIRVAMVTGDHPVTALAIAKQVGLVDCEHVDELEVRTGAADEVVIACLNSNYLLGVHHLDHAVGSPSTDMTARMRAHGEQLVFTNDVAPTSGQNTQLLKGETALGPKSITLDHKFLYSAGHEHRLNRALVVTGTEIELFDTMLWSWVLRHTQIVFARTTPEQKLRIVMEAQARGESVGVTGDGVNDAPALRRADLGIAMQSGSELAREAGHMVLMDNNFGSIIEGIELGRTMFDNLKKVCIYLLPAGSFSEAITVLAQVFFGIPQPLGSFYMIIICVFTDVFLSSALMYENAEADVMSRKPRVVKQDRLVDWKLLVYAWLNIGVIESIAAWTVFFWYLDVNGLPPRALVFSFNSFPSSADSTIVYYGLDSATCYELLYRANALFFTTLVIVQVGNLLSVRTRRSSIVQHNPFWGPNRNIRIPIGVTIAVAMMLLVTLTPWFHDVFDTAYSPLPFSLAALGFAGAVIAYDELRKSIVRRFPASVVAKVAW